jgi:3-hydroxyisobutyrate dehydrogenase
MDLGFCGTGRMGAAIVHRLLDKGHRVTVWNRTPEKAQPLAERGAALARSPVEIAAAGGIVLSILTDERAVEAVYDGSEGLLSGDVAGTLFIEMSTVAPASVRRLAERVRSKRASLVECPVGGTVGPAREGRLIGLAGGEAADFERARPVLAEMCRRVDHVGPNGAGAAAKLAINLPLAVYWEALGEALSLCRDEGVDPARLLDIMTESSGGANALKNRAPKVLAALKEGAKPEVGFDIDGIRKDLRTMVEVARTLGFVPPVAAKALECYDEAAREGWGDRDGSSVAAYRVREAGKASKRP